MLLLMHRIILRFQIGKNLVKTFRCLVNRSLKVVPRQEKSRFWVSQCNPNSKILCYLHHPSNPHPTLRKLLLTTINLTSLTCKTRKKTYRTSSTNWQQLDTTSPRCSKMLQKKSLASPNQTSTTNTISTGMRSREASLR